MDKSSAVVVEDMIGQVLAASKVRALCTMVRFYQANRGHQLIVRRRMHHSITTQPSSSKPGNFY